MTVKAEPRENCPTVGGLATRIVRDWRLILATLPGQGGEMGGFGHRGHTPASGQFSLCPGQEAIGGRESSWLRLSLSAAPTDHPVLSETFRASLSSFCPACWGLVLLFTWTPAPGEDTESGSTDKCPHWTTSSGRARWARQHPQADAAEGVGAGRLTSGSSGCGGCSRGPRASSSACPRTSARGAAVPCQAGRGRCRATAAASPAPRYTWRWQALSAQKGPL